MRYDEKAAAEKPRADEKETIDGGHSDARKFPLAPDDPNVIDGGNSASRKKPLERV